MPVTPIRSFKLGPGILTLTPAGGGAAQSIEQQITKIEIDPTEKITAGDVIPVLSGAELAEEDEVTYECTMSATVLQDLEVAGFLSWSWAHKGEIVAFTFVPNGDQPQGVQGYVRVAPVKLGGDVKKRNTSDLKWRAFADAAQQGIPSLYTIP